MISLALIILSLSFIISAIIDTNRWEKWYLKDSKKEDKKPMFMVHGIDGSLDRNIGATRWILGVVILIVVIVAQLAVYIKMIDKEADYKVFDSKKEILIDRQKVLVDELKFEAQKYVNYEKELFNNLKPNNTQILFNAYPDLKAHEPIRKVMDEITKLSDDVIKLELERQDIRTIFININSNALVIFRSHYE